MKSLRPKEAEIHIGIADFVRLMEVRDPRYSYIWHTPNGEVRSKATAAKLKRMLVRPGVPDFICPHPGSCYRGFAMEVKRMGEKLTKEQESFFGFLSSLSWTCVTVRSVRGGIAFLENYFGD